MLLGTTVVASLLALAQHSSATFTSGQALDSTLAVRDLVQGVAQIDGSFRNVTFDRKSGVIEWSGDVTHGAPLVDRAQHDGLSTVFSPAALFEFGAPEAAGDDHDLEKRDGGLEKRRRRHRKHRKHRKSKKGRKSKGGKKKPTNVQLNSKGGFSSIITWYTGEDLKNPYCADGSGWTPTDNSMIAAVTLEWGPGKPPCGSFLQLRAPGVNRAIVVRVVDACGGCQPGVPHVDLTLRAFKALYPLDVGKVSGIQVSYVGGPSNWNGDATDLYGPRNL